MLSVPDGVGWAPGVTDSAESSPHPAAEAKSPATAADARNRLRVRS
jgi:hypothetical protein